MLKGGLFIYSVTDFDSRVTVDVDFLPRKSAGKNATTGAITIHSSIPHKPGLKFPQRSGRFVRNNSINLSTASALPHIMSGCIRRSVLSLSILCHCLVET